MRTVGKASWETTSGEVVYMALEAEFEAQMHKALREAAKLGYRPTRFEEKMEREGAVAYAKELVISGEFQSGLKRLKQMNRLDLSIEHLVANCPRFHCLFTKDEIEAARWRLDEVS